MLKIACEVIGDDPEFVGKKFTAVLRMVPKKPGQAELYERLEESATLSGEPIFVRSDKVKYDFNKVELPVASENLQGFYNEYDVKRKDGKHEMDATYVVLRIDSNMENKQRLIANRFAISEAARYMFTVCAVCPDDITYASDMFNLVQLLHWVDIAGDT
jgi:hypothetical protein